MSKYGTTKLDHILSHISYGFIKTVKWFLMLAAPLVVVEQIIIYCTNHASWALPALIGIAVVEVAAATLFKFRKK